MGCTERVLSVIEKENDRILELCNCFQASVAYFCIKNGSNPLICLINGFSLEYKKNNNIWEGIRLYTPNIYEDLDESTSCLNFESCEIDFYNLTGCVKFDLGGILIRSDSYFCPWNKAYLKTHIPHFCILKSYDADLNMLICDDPFLNKKDVYWPLNIIKHSEFKLYKVFATRVKQSSIKKKADALFSNIRIDVIEVNYSEFIEDIKLVKTKEMLFESNNPNLCSIIIFAKQMVNNYSGLIMVINECQSMKKYQIVLSELREAEKIWNKISYFLIRLCIINDNDINITPFVELLDKARTIDILILRKINNA